MPVNDPKMCEEILTLRSEITIMKKEIESLNTTIKEISEHVKTLVEGKQQTDGAARLLRFIFIIAAPAIAAIVWIKQHVNF